MTGDDFLGGCTVCGRLPASPPCDCAARLLRILHSLDAAGRDTRTATLPPDAETQPMLAVADEDVPR